MEELSSLLDVMHRNIIDLKKLLSLLRLLELVSVNLIMVKMMDLYVLNLIILYMIRFVLMF